MTAKRIGAATLLVVATLLWSAATLGIWAKRQALNTDNWVQTSSDLLQNDRIRNTLAVALVDRLYDTAAVQKQIADQLPPRLDRLAAPAAAGLREIALRNAPRVLGSPAALKAWQASNRAAHNTFIAIVDGKVAKGGVVTLNVKDLLSRVADGTGLPAGLADKLPPSVATIQVLQSNQVKTAQDAVRGFRDSVWVIIALAVICFAGARPRAPARVRERRDLHHDLGAARARDPQGRGQLARRPARGRAQRAGGLGRHLVDLDLAAGRRHRRGVPLRADRRVGGVARGPRARRDRRAALERPGVA